jgi:mycothiol synthase
VVDLRAVRADDLDEVCALANRIAEHDGADEVMTVDEIRQILNDDAIDPNHDVRVAVLDGELVGWLYVLNPPARVRIDRALLLGDVDPRHRGRGIGSELLAWGIQRAVERMTRRDHDLPRYIWVTAYDWMERNRRLYARFGFAPVRWFEDLTRPITEVPVVRVPDDIALVPWGGDRDEEIRLARNTAFADHWGSEPMDAATWHDLVRGYGARPDLSVVAVERSSGTVVGMCLNHVYPGDEERTGRREAWVHNIATLAAWRGKGLATAMLTWSLRAFAAAEFTHAVLTVDTDSPTGAGRLYRALGFEPLRRSVRYQLDVPPRGH